MTRKAMLYHCRTLTVACNYSEGETMVNVLDFKRDVGLWHSILAVSDCICLYHRGLIRELGLCRV